MATVIVLPALLLSFWLVLQYAVAAHVRNVAQAAAQDAALALASGGDAGVAGATRGQLGRSLTSNVVGAAERDGRRR